MPNPLLLAAAPAAISGIAGLFGQKSTNKQNLKIAREQMGFQERMRNTQWQSAVEDMRAAGINPALAYQQGGNAAPGGASAVMGNEVSSALEAMQMQKTLQLMNHQVAEQKGKAKVAQAEGTLAKDRQSYLTNRFEVNGRKSVPLWHDMIDSEISSARWGATNMKALSERNKALTDNARPMADLSNRMGEFLPILGLAGGVAGGATNMFLRNASRKRKLAQNALKKKPRADAGGLRSLMQNRRRR